MLDSTQVFGALAVLFLVFSVPFPGKIRLGSEIFPFQRSAVVRSGGVTVAPVSNGSSRRRTRLENRGFVFSSPEEASAHSAFSDNEFKVFDERYQEEAEEELFDVPAEAFSRKLERGDDQGEPSVENMGWPGLISTETPAAVVDRIHLQAASGTINQLLRIPSVATSPFLNFGSTVAGAFGQEQLAALNTEELFASVFGEECEEVDFIPSAGIVFRVVSVDHMVGSHLAVMLPPPETWDSSQCMSLVSLPSNFSGGRTFFSQKESAEAETETCHPELPFRSSPPLAGKRRRSSYPSSLSETTLFGGPSR